MKDKTIANDKRKKIIKKYPTKELSPGIYSFDISASDMNNDIIYFYPVISKPHKKVRK